MSSPPSSPAPPPTMLFLFRFLHPVALLVASFFNFSLPSTPYFFVFLWTHRRPAYSVYLSRFPAIQLLAILLYSFLAILAHITLTILVETHVINLDSISEETILSLAIPRYSPSAWRGIRFLLPHVFVFVSTLSVLLARIPDHHRYARSQFIVAWFRRRRRQRLRHSNPRPRPNPPDPSATSPPDRDHPPLTTRNRAQFLLSRGFSRRPPIQPTPSHDPTHDPLDADQPHSDFGSLITDDDIDLGIVQQKRNHQSGGTPITKFVHYMAGRAGLFWCTASTALVAVSYSSLCTFVFLAVFSSIVVSLAFQLDGLHPRTDTTRFLRYVRIYRTFLTAYLSILFCFQLPWLVRWSAPEKDIVSSVLQFIGLVPINTAKPAGWTAVTAFGAAIATYLFTGMFESSLRVVQESAQFAEEQRSGESGTSSPIANTEVEIHPTTDEPAQKPSYHEFQLLLTMRHASSLGLLTWALVFPGILTLPLLFAAILYLSLKNSRSSRLFDFLVVYALFLNMAHYLLIAVMDAFRPLDDDSAIQELLGLRSLPVQFAVNVIESVALGLLCLNLFSKRYLDGMQTILNHTSPGDVSGPMQIRDFVQMSLFSSRSRKRDSPYSPMKLCIDQIALASLYVAGGLDLTALNAVFLVALSTLCILQSFGLFRRPRLFATVWSIVLVYAILFLLTTGTFCRAVDSVWECNVDDVGVKMADSGQVVAYAATVVLSSVQVNFTWSTKSDEAGDVKEFDGVFWRALRKYFLYVAYAALLLYPLLFHANFLSYGYVIFLFLSLVVEILPTSLRGRKSTARRVVKKYWILIILFACAAMLARYFVSLLWPKGGSEAPRWFFGLDLDPAESQTFVATFGDAIILIFMSLQGRLFVVDFIFRTITTGQRWQGSTQVSDGTLEGDVDNRDTLSEPGDLGSAAEKQTMMRPKHRRHKSLEEYLTAEFSAEPLSSIPEAESQGAVDGLSGRRTMHHTSRSHRSVSEVSASSRPRDSDSETMRRFEEEQRRKNELQKVLNRKRVEQALDMFRNFRKSVPVKQTEKFLHETYALSVVLLRSGILSYSYILASAAILAASIWLPGVSVFGAVYIFLGCVVLLAEQPSFSRDEKNPPARSGQRIAKSMPALLLILSFSLMSAQYIFLVVFLIVESLDVSTTAYIGLQVPADTKSVPITVEAMIAHVLVFITAVVQKVAVRWARMDAERIEEENTLACDTGARFDDPVESANALDSAVPIGSVIKGVGGSSSKRISDTSAAQSSFMSSYPGDGSETPVWRPGPLQSVASNDTTESHSSLEAPSTRPFDAGKESERDKIEQVRGKVVEILKNVYDRVAAVFSLLAPFWANWGSDVTFMYLVICGAATETVFSVIYVGIVLGVGGLRRREVQRHWHQLTLLLVVLVLIQYLLTLGLPAEENRIEDSQSFDAWKVWLLLDRENDSSMRKVAITIAFIAVICAAITLNSISDGSRPPSYWFQNLQSKEIDSACLHAPEIASGDPISAHMPPGLSSGSDHHDNYRGGGISSQVPRNEGESIHGRHLSPEGPEERTRADEDLTHLHRPRISDMRTSSMIEERERRPHASPLGNAAEGGRRTMVDIDQSASSSGTVSETSSKEIERQILRPNDPNDFTRRPISFQNLVKLTWMRFMGAFVQLFMFAVATVDTNVISAVLLMSVFSFLFLFTDVSAKKTRFKYLRGYVIVVVFALVIFQAPFEKSKDGGWEDILGLYKDDTKSGETMLYLMVSLWILCQVQGRIYESKDFTYVERYGHEDAKVRFKRAVHEHNGRKYDKLLDRNKAERSHYARKARLTRLKSLKESERTVDAFYNVCVVHEIDFLRNQADTAGKNPSSFLSHRWNEEPPSEENLPRGINKFIRSLLRGRRWKQYRTQTLPSEVKAFVFRYSAWPVYVTMVLAALINPSITTIAYPLAVFLYLIVEQPRPPKHAWTVLMIYVCCAIAFKYVFRSKYLPLCDADVPFFALSNGDRSPPGVRNFRDCSPAAGIGFDIFVLLALLGHRAVLYSRGVWDLVMSEEDMLLRSEIRGYETDTAPEMSFSAESVSESEDDKAGTGSLRGEDDIVEHTWSAEQQCEDVEHILSQARRDILGVAQDQIETGKKATTPSPLGPQARRDILGVAQDQVETGKKATTPSPLGPRRILSIKSTRGGRPPLPNVGVSSTNMHPRAGHALFRDREDISDGLRRRAAVVRPMQRPDDLRDRERGVADREKVKAIPQSAPAPTGALRRSDFRSTPSVQGSDSSRVHLNLRRFRSFGIGTHRQFDPLATPGPMTSGQSRVQESLTQAKIIPRYSAAGQGRSLALFHAEQRGFFAFLRQHFLRLTRENDYKAVGDYYLVIFIVDFISFVYVMFGFSVIFGDSTSGRKETWWTTNFIETRHLLTLLIMFAVIILDRICYLTKSMTGKLILQYASVIIYHVVLFVIQDHIGERVATRIFYILRCVYFLLSGLQIRDGFPMYTTAQFLLRNYTTLGIVLFEIYIFVPFLWLSRTLLDWAVLPTSLEIFQYFRFIDIYLWLYRNRAVNTSRGRFRRKLGEKRRMLPRVYQGFGLFLLCVIALFLPFIIFSILNPFFVGRELSSATVNVNLVTFESPFTSGGRTYEVYSRTSVVGEALDQNQSSAAANTVGVKVDVREREKVFEAWFSAISGNIWHVAEEDQDNLVTSLQQYSSESFSGVAPKLDFSLAATTQDRDTFGTRQLQHTYTLTPSQAGDIANALSEEHGFAMRIQSPLPRYSILQSGSAVFESYPGQQGVGDVCIRFIQERSAPNVGFAFWTMSSMEPNQSSCSNITNFGETTSKRRHLLQIADISNLQVGGATILTLYTAILFTIANLLKRMFIDKRLIIPYIDMPYTLHLYQLVLDIMYARQDNQLEMEEILYNGLIDIYRDQHELVRWTGERTLKLPEAWWDKAEVENPFMVYPSFAETSTEPYLDRVVE